MQPSVAHGGDGCGGDGQFTSTDDEDTGLPAPAREQYIMPGLGQWQPGFLAYAGQSSSGFSTPQFIPGQSSSGYTGTPYVQGPSSSVQPELQESYPQSGFLASVVDEFLGAVPEVGMAQQHDMFAYQTMLQSQSTGPPPPQRSLYPLRTDTRSPDRWTYSTGHARRKTRPRTRTQPPQAESSDSEE